MSPPFTIGAHEEIRMNQRTLVLVLAAFATAAAAWVDLHNAIGRHDEKIVSLISGQEAAKAAYEADHEIIIHIADQLKWSIKDQATHEKNPNPDMPSK
jgi:hypothetical protein